MSPQPYYSDVNRDVVRSLDVPGTPYFIWMSVCAATLFCFVVALSWQIDLGLGLTGLRTPQYWALYITNFVFWIGIGHAGTIDDPASCGRQLDQALNTPGPVVVEAVVDPLEPPMPAKVTMEQAAKFAKSLVRGEPNRERIALTILSDKVRELV